MDLAYWGLCQHRESLVDTYIACIVCFQTAYPISPLLALGVKLNVQRGDK